MANVLVLDDVLDAVNLMKRILNAMGHEVAGFTEEEDALIMPAPIPWIWPYWISN